MTNILTSDIYKELLGTDKLVLIDFWADWCPPCRTMSPIFEAISQSKEFNHIHFYKCNVDIELRPFLSIFHITSKLGWSLLQSFYS